jgi:hypothetical protein
MGVFGSSPASRWAIAVESEPPDTIKAIALGFGSPDIAETGIWQRLSIVCLTLAARSLASCLVLAHMQVFYIRWRKAPGGRQEGARRALLEGRCAMLRAYPPKK